MLRAILNPHLDVAALADNGVDVSYIDLYQETEHGGPYFLPTSQSRLETLDQRPPFDMLFSMEEVKWNYSDAHVLDQGFGSQLQESRDGGVFEAIKTIQWRIKESVISSTFPSENLLTSSRWGKRSCIERLLYEYAGCADDQDPTRQHH